MIGKAELSGHKRQGAERLDRPATDFRAICGERLLELARIERGERVLDVATGASLDLPDNSFDAVICSLGIVFLPVCSLV